MQAPLYKVRKQHLALIAASAGDTTSYWGRHGMRDIIAVVSGMISQVALSFARFCGEYAILWCDLRDGSKRVIGKGIDDEIANRGDDIRYELRPAMYHAKEVIEVHSVSTKDGISAFDGPSGHSSTFPAGQDMAIYCSTSLIVITMDGCTFYEASSAASTLRFERDSTIWLNSDGQIHTEKY